MTTTMEEEGARLLQMQKRTQRLKKFKGQLQQKERRCYDLIT